MMMLRLYIEPSHTLTLKLRSTGYIRVSCHYYQVHGENKNKTNKQKHLKKKCFFSMLSLIMINCKKYIIIIYVYEGWCEAEE